MRTDINEAPRPYIIMHLHDHDYWSNEHGWTEMRGQATNFNEVERKTFDLPIDGEWVRLLTQT